MQFNDTFNLEVLKFVFKFQAKLLLLPAFKIIFYKQRKHIVIPQDLLQMKIGHSCIAINKSHKDQFDM